MDSFQDFPRTAFPEDLTALADLAFKMAVKLALGK
jgi:hypothetical protein